METIGKNVILSGFSDLDESELSAVHRTLRSFISHIESNSDYQEFSLHVKRIHEREHSELFEVAGKLMIGKALTSTHTDRNLYVAIDKVLHSIENQL